MSYTEGTSLHTVLFLFFFIFHCSYINNLKGKVTNTTLLQFFSLEFQWKLILKINEKRIRNTFINLHSCTPLEIHFLVQKDKDLVRLLQMQKNLLIVNQIYKSLALHQMGVWYSHRNKAFNRYTQLSGGAEVAVAPDARGELKAPLLYEKILAIYMSHSR